MIIGTMWVDARDGSLVQIDGVASKNPSVFSGTTHMMRQYTNIDGYSMAIHARAESDSSLFGRTVVTIDYSDYKLEITEPANSASLRARHRNRHDGSRSHISSPDRENGQVEVIFRTDLRRFFAKSVRRDTDCAASRSQTPIVSI